MKNELRIGNLVWDFNVIHPTEKFVSIETIEEEGCLLRNERGVYRIKYCCIKPIPLTEEWLIRFSFEYLRRKGGTLGVYSNGKMNLILSNSGNVYTMKNKLIPYVHTLQNYYYFTLLTGEELTIKYD